MFLFYGVMAWFSEGYSHADEHFQLLEFAAYKLHQYSYQYPWELYSQIRPTVQVWIVIWLYKVLSFITPQVTPFFIAFLMRLLAALLAAVSCYLLVNAFKEELSTPNQKKWFYLLSAFSYPAVYCAVRYASESCSASLFVIALSLIFLNSSLSLANNSSCREGASTIHSPWGWYFLSGVLLGASFMVRFQTGLMIAGLMAWLLLYKKIKWPVFCVLLGGFVLFFMLGTYLDFLFYGKVVCTPWRYFDVNLLQGRSSVFGRSYWTYFNIATYIPYGPLYIVSILFFIMKWPNHVMSWIAIPFLFIHFIIPHKEVRFLIPLLGFMPFMLIVSFQWLQTAFAFNLKTQRQFLRAQHVVWSINGILLLIIMLIDHQQFGVYKYLWAQYRQQPVSLNLFTKNQELYQDNAIALGMPLRFYLSEQIYTKNYNPLVSLSCKKGSTCLIWMPCYEKVQGGMTLLYDSCLSENIRKYINLARWMDKSIIFRQNGRLYDVLPHEQAIYKSVKFS